MFQSPEVCLGAGIRHSQRGLARLRELRKNIMSGTGARPSSAAQSHPGTAPRPRRRPTISERCSTACGSWPTTRTCRSSPLSSPWRSRRQRAPNRRASRRADPRARRRSAIRAACRGAGGARRDRARAERYALCGSRPRSHGSIRRYRRGSGRARRRSAPARSGGCRAGARARALHPRRQVRLRVARAGGLARADRRHDRGHGKLEPAP